MLQYLLNTTAIWLLSLVLFDLFLRKESYHNYNRFYLLFTFLLGALLPLFHWQYQYVTTITQSALQHPVQQVITAKENIITATIPLSPAFNWAQLFMVVYVTGFIVTLCILLLDLVKLVKYYHGHKSKEDNWLVIETGREHAPFSFLNALFVHSKLQYDTNEWNMIIIHEKRHYKLLHAADLLLMQLSRIIFWFHPLVYVYNARLLLVHEYQADKTTAQPQVYGKFLVEQAILQSAPALSHSFNRAPIKNRIVMLTHRSSEIAKSKLLVFIPLVVVCILCFSQNSFSNKPKKEGNKCTYRGNTIEFLAPQKPDSYLYTDEKTGETSRKPISWPTPPIKVNGDKIYDPYNDKNIQPPVLRSSCKNLAVYIMQNAKKEMETLNDGKYFFIISDVVINAKGMVVYFDDQGIFQVGVEIDKQPKSKQIIDNKINDLMNDAPLFEPAKVNNAPASFLINSVTCFSYGYDNGWDFTVKDHKIIWDVTSGTIHPKD